MQLARRQQGVAPIDQLTQVHWPQP
jgi:hypothetical protein